MTGRTPGQDNSAAHTTYSYLRPNFATTSNIERDKTATLRDCFAIFIPIQWRIHPYPILLHTYGTSYSLPRYRSRAFGTLLTRRSITPLFYLSIHHYYSINPRTNPTYKRKRNTEQYIHTYTYTYTLSQHSFRRY